MRETQAGTLLAVRASRGFDGTQRLGPSTVLVAGGKIVDLDTTGAPPPAHAQLIDLGSAAFLLPGSSMRIPASALMPMPGGARIVPGTDAGVAPLKPHDVLPYGIAELNRTGNDNLEALRAATALAADACGLTSRKGRLIPGADADLLAVTGDPLANIHAIQHVAAVMRAGRWVHCGRYGRTGDQSAGPGGARGPATLLGVGDAVTGPDVPVIADFLTGNPQEPTLPWFRRGGAAMERARLDRLARVPHDARTRAGGRGSFPDRRARHRLRRAGCVPHPRRRWSDRTGAQHGGRPR
jgi:hypothetical protein